MNPTDRPPDPPQEKASHHQRAVEAHERAAETHERAAKLHEQSADLHDEHVKEMREKGLSPQARRAELIAGDERDLVAKERLAAERERTQAAEARQEHQTERLPEAEQD